MPQESRDGFVSALDLTSADMDAPEGDLVPVGDADMGMEPEDDMQDVNDFDDVSVASTLATAGIIRRRPVVDVGSYSVQASAVLQGTQPLFTM
jgi:hypothetical protein